MARHLLAMTVGNNMLRDPESAAMNDEEFEALLHGKALPPHHYAYHEYGPEHWKLILAIPEIRRGTIREQLPGILLALCCQCWKGLAGEDGRCQECLEEAEQGG